MTFFLAQTRINSLPLKNVFKGIKNNINIKRNNCNKTSDNFKFPLLTLHMHSVTAFQKAIATIVFIKLFHVLILDSHVS